MEVKKATDQVHRLVALSLTQRYIWLDEKIGGNSARFNIGGYASISGNMNYHALSEAISTLLDSNEIFKLQFSERDGVPYQYHRVSNNFTLEHLDFSGHGENAESACMDWMQSDIQVPVTLERPFFSCVLKSSNSQVFWYMKIHHILVDGWAFSLIFKTVAAYYNDLCKGKQPIIAEECEYEEFCKSSSEFVHSMQYAEARKFWMDKFAHFDPSHSTTATIPAVLPSSIEHKVTLPRSLYNRLVKYCSQVNASTFHFFLATLYLVVAKVKDKRHITISVPVLNRSERHFRNKIGLFMNLLPVPLHGEGSSTFHAFLEKVKAELRSCYRHQKFQYGELLSILREKYSNSGSLTDVRLSYEKYDYTACFGDCATRIVALTHRHEVDPVSIFIREYSSEDPVVIDFNFNPGFYSEMERKHLAEAYERIIHEVLDHPLNSLRSFSILSREDKTTVLRFAQGKRTPESSTTISQIIRSHANSLNPAVIAGDRHVNFSELIQRSDALAQLLHSEFGDVSGCKIPFITSRGINSIIALLGILKAGAYFVPLDLLYPTHRLKFIIEDCNAVVLLCDQTTEAKAKDLYRNVLLLDSAVQRIAVETLDCSKSGGYVIYTSGTTGKPKGVEVAHSSLLDYSLNFIRYFELHPGDRVMHQASISFDTSLEEIVPILLCGGSLVVAEHEKDIYTFNDLISRHQVTVLSTNPFVIDLLNTQNCIPQCLRILISGGDELKPNHITNLYNKTRVFNTYGPTECTICSTYYEIKETEKKIAIGKPITNREVLILDDNLDLTPIGIVGEICISGSGLATRYSNDVDLTGQKFPAHPFREGQRIFRTGDLGRWTDEGNIEFLGRKDRQIKISGYRIELGEIEEGLASYSPIKTGIAVVHGQETDKKIVVYLVPREESLDLVELGQHLSERLPPYMMPADYVVLSEFPMTINGKIDVKNLPKPSLASGKSYVAPRTDLEKKVEAIWKKLLGASCIGLQDNFFELGGNSLKANSFIAAFRQELGVDYSLRMFFENPTIEGIVATAEQSTKDYLPITAVSRNLEIPASFEQERIWFIQKLDPENKSYHVPRAIHVKGKLQPRIIEQTLNHLIRRHEVLRLTFVEKDGILTQQIRTPFEFKADLIDITGTDHGNVADVRRNLVLDEGQLAFDLKNGPLFRLKLVKLAEDEYLMIWCQHHLIHDGWAQGVFLREFMHVYESLILDRSITLPALPIQFPDYAYWQRNYFTQERLKQHLSYWKRKLDGVPSLIELPTDRRRPAFFGGKGELVEVHLGLAVSRRLRQFSRKQNSTLFITMLAVFKVMLYRISGQPDFCVGGAFAKRKLAEIEGMLGMVINTLPLRTSAHPGMSFTEYLGNVKVSCVEALEHEDTPFHEIVNALKVERDLSYLPLVQVSFGFMDTPTKRFTLPGQVLTIEDSHNRSAKFDLTFLVITPHEQLSEAAQEQDEDIIIEAEFNSEIFDHSTIETFLNIYRRLVVSCLEEPTLKLGAFPLASQEEEESIVAAIRNNYHAPGTTGTIISTFKKAVQQFSSHVAVFDGASTLTYEELEIKSNSLASKLCEGGIKKNTPVALLTDRSPEMIIAMLAVMKAGGAYVPVDPSFPVDRIEYLIADSESPIMLTNRQTPVLKVGPCKVIDLNNTALYTAGTAFEWDDEPDGIAYIIYTSGSTGKPKGVAVEHRAIMNTLLWRRSYYEFNDRDIVLQLPSFSFDSSVVDIFTPLISGAQVRLISNTERLDSAVLRQIVSTEGVTHFLAVPSLYRELVQVLDNCPKLRSVTIAGENFHPDLVGEHYKRVGHVRLVNEYGPTENSVCSTAFTFTSASDAISIGKPISNVGAIVLDAFGKILPNGLPGELYLYGKGLARGYFNRPDLNSQFFIHPADLLHVRMYKTGDIVKTDQGGNLIFLGRNDDQIKIRGHRIEVSEIELTLVKVPGVLDCAVRAWQDKRGASELVAYVVLNHEISQEAIRIRLREYLPEYMIPGHIVFLEKLPLSPNGKIDRNALPPLTGKNAGNETPHVGARNQLEAKLAEIWSDVLGTTRIAIHSNFFHLGGHSLSTIRVVNQVRSKLGLEIRIADIFKYPTIAMLAEVLQKNAHFSPIPQYPSCDSYPVTPSQRRLWVLSQFELANIAYNIFSAVRIIGKVSVQQLTDALRQIVARHESLRTVFRTGEDGELRQHVVPVQDASLSNVFMDISMHENPDIEISNYIRREQLQPFDLANEILIRTALFRLNQGELVLVFTTSHLISDGWSMEVLTRELLTLCQGSDQAESSDQAIPPLRIQYKDYSLWLADEMKKYGFEQAELFWFSQFEKPLPLVDLSFAKRRPTLKTYNGFSIMRQLPLNLVGLVEQQLAAYDATLFMGLVTALNILVYRYTSSGDIIIGTPVAGRTHMELENQVGLYLNTLAIRTRLEGSEDFHSVLTGVKKTLLDAYTYQSYPFDLLVDKLKLETDVSRAALFDIFIVLQSQKDANLGRSDGIIEIKPFEFEARKVSQFDISFFFVKNDAGLSLKIEYNTDLFDKDDMVRMAAHFESLLSLLVTYPEIPVSSHVYMSSEEQLLVLQKFPRAVSYEVEKTMVEVLALNQAQHNLTALVFKKRVLTYGELDRLSNKFAHYLVNKYKVGAGDAIGVKIERSEWLPIVLLAILKTGAAYVPLDIRYPESRSEYIRADSGCRVIIDKAGVDGFSEKEYTDSALNIVVRPHDAAYVIYTSGSTGNPKGVVIEHRNVAAFLLWALEEFHHSRFETVYALTSVCFDLSIFEIFFSLVARKKIRILTSPEEIANCLQEDQDVLLNTVPSVLASLIEGDVSLENVSVLNLAGEPLTSRVIQGIDLQYTEVRNLYGPTEDTTYSTCFRITDNQSEIIPIGKPIHNTSVYILDPESLGAQPVGVTGELFLSGKGLAREYLNKRDLTAQSFLPSPFASGEKLYRTGDLARWLPDGNIEFLGRKDNQVKINGFRIELGEIETVISQQVDIVKQVVVEACDTEERKTLTAFVVLTERSTIDVLKNRVKSLLPNYMVPEHFTALEQLPLTINGKIDRLALRVLKPILKPMFNEPPRNELQRRIQQHWRSLLDVENIGINDNFFALGGHSLKAIKFILLAKKYLHLDLTLKDIFRRPTIREIEEFLSAGAIGEFVGIPQSQRRPYYPLSAGQKRLWVLDKLESHLTAYLVPLTCVIRNIELEQFLAAIRAVVQRHEILRTRFLELDGIPYQEIIEITDHEPYIEVFDFRSHTNSLSSAEQLARESFVPFDLEKAPLLRIKLIALHDDSWFLSMVLHHIVADAWSVEILVKEISETYQQLARGIATPFHELRIQYKDFSEWQTSNTTTKALDEQYWLETLHEVPVLNVPTDFPRPSMQTYRGRRTRLTLGNEICLAMNKLSVETHISDFAILAAAVGVLIFRYSGQERFVVGVPVTGRNHPDLLNQVGYYVNTLPVIIGIHPEDQFLQLATQFQQTFLTAQEHQAYQFDKLVDRLDLPRDLSRSPLFDVMISFLEVDTIQKVYSDTGVSVAPYRIDYGVTKFDITFDFVRSGSELFVEVEYSTDLFLPERIEAMGKHLRRVIVDGLNNASSPVGRINMLEGDEEQKLLRLGNVFSTISAGKTTFVDHLERIVLRNPEKTAVIFNDIELTYQALNAKANRIAHLLKKEFGIGRGSIVALALPKDENTVPIVLAILKTNAAFLPIDADLPHQRIADILNDAQPKLIVSRHDAEAIPALKQKFISVQELDKRSMTFSITDLNERCSIDDLAYVIYTSGSTGKPKGVMVGHANLMSVGLSWLEKYNLDSYEVRLLQIASIAFDVFVGDLCRSLLSGGTLVLCPNEKTFDFNYLYMLIEREQVNIFESTPSIINALVTYIQSNALAFPRLRMLIFGSDVLLWRDFEKVRKLAGKECRVVNSYGTTETTIDSSYFELKNSALEYAKVTVVPIGKPLPNTSYFVLDQTLNMLPVGVTGDLYIGGAGVAVGYLNRPDITHQKFIANPFRPGERLYRTGDQARWNFAGTLEFHGRIDRQLKVGGVRIEPEEIEHALLLYPGITNCTVTCRDRENTKVLVAYIVSNADLDHNAIRQFLVARLPQSMVPFVFIQVGEIPLNTSGKVDHASLPKLPSILESQDLPPATHTERIVLEKFRELLQTKIGITQNFFEQGGNSLRALQLLAYLNNHFRLDLKLRDIFLYPTVRDLSGAIASRTCDTLLSLEPLQNHLDDYELSYFQKRLWFINQINPSDTTFNDPTILAIKGELDVNALQQAFLLLIERHDVLRTNYVMRSGEPRQVVREIHEVVPQFRVVDLRDDCQDKNEPIRRSVNRIFDLEDGSLIDISLFRFNESTYVLVVLMHHIISDGWSAVVLMREIIPAYRSLLSGKRVNLEKLKIQYKDFAAWQNAYLQNQGISAHKQFWLQYLSGKVPSPELPTDFPRAKARKNAGECLHFTLDSHITANIRSIAKKENSTAFMVVLAALNLVMYAFSGEQGNVIGTPVDGRDHPELEKMFGYFLNVLPIAVYIDQKETVHEYLARTRENVISIFEHKAYPLEMIIDDMKLRRDLNRNPVFEINLVYNNIDVTQDAMAVTQDVMIEPYEIDLGVSKNDLKFSFSEYSEYIKGFINYRMDLFTSDTINSLKNDLIEILNGMACDQSVRVSDIVQKVFKKTV
jgi:tyrocidine synthetase III